MEKKLIVSIAILCALAAVTLVVFLPHAPAESADAAGLPAYARMSAAIEEAYLYAKENPDKLNGINCYCGCMQMLHDNRIHKRGLLDCFINDDGSYDDHGASCAMCVTDTLQVKSLYAQGMTKDQIKAIIDAKYARWAANMSATTGGNG